MTDERQEPATTSPSPRWRLRHVVATGFICAGLAGTAVWIARPPVPSSTMAGTPAEAHEEEDGEGSGGVTLTPEAQQAAGIVVAVAERRTVPVTLNVTGTVAPEGSRTAEIRALARGRVTATSVRLGDRVRAGQTLVTYDNIQLGELLGEFYSARAALAQADSDLIVRQRALERADALITQQAIAQQVVDLRAAEYRNAQATVQSARAQLERIDEQVHRFGLTEKDVEALRPGNRSEPSHRSATLASIRAPFDGVVTAFDAAVGETIEPERPIVTVTNLSTVWVLADVYEADLARVPSAADVVVRVDAYPERQFPGRLTYVADVIDPQSRAAKVRCEVQNPEGLLRLDMFARVAIPTRDRRDAVTVPAEAIQRLGERTVVFVRTAPTRFEPRDVVVGQRAGTLAEIVSGLTTHEAVVGAGSFYCKTAVQRRQIGHGH